MNAKEYLLSVQGEDEYQDWAIELMEGYHQAKSKELLIAFKDWYNSDERNEYHLNIGEINAFLGKEKE